MAKILFGPTPLLGGAVATQPTITTEPAFTAVTGSALRYVEFLELPSGQGVAWGISAATMQHALADPPITSLLEWRIGGCVKLTTVTSAVTALHNLMRVRQGTTALATLSMFANTSTSPRYLRFNTVSPMFTWTDTVAMTINELVQYELYFKRVPDPLSASIVFSVWRGNVDTKTATPYYTTTQPFSTSFSAIANNVLLGSSSSTGARANGGHFWATDGVRLHEVPAPSVGPKWYYRNGASEILASHVNFRNGASEVPVGLTEFYPPA